MTSCWQAASSCGMTWFGRIDHNFSVKDRLSFTLNMPRSRYTEKYGGGHPSTTAIPYIEKYHYHNLSLAETHAFGPRILNEFTVAHNRHFDVTTEGDGSIRDPELSVDASAYGGLGFGYGAYEGGLIAGFVQDRWQYQDNLGWSVGKHSFKLGFGWMWGNFYRNWDLGLPGHYSFANTTGPTPESYGVDALPRLEVIKTVEPASRKAGVKVKTVGELVDKLRNEAGVL